MSRVKIYPNSKYRQPEWDEEGTPEILSSTEESGTCNINFHGIRNKDCDLRYAVAASFRKNWLYFRPQVGAFFIKVALRNKCFYQLGKSEPRELKEGQFIVFVGKRVRCKTILPRAG